MSEYIEIDAEFQDDGSILIVTNLPLTIGETEEYYSSLHDMDTGSPVAQTLAGIEGIDVLQITGSELLIACRPDADRHVIVSDVSAALKEFFL